MPEIRFDTGLVTYDLNGACQVTFNPTDSSFVERLLSAMEAMDKVQEEHNAQMEKDEDSGELFRKARERDKDMREILDRAFDVPVCAALFGEMNLYAMADGLPVWCNLVLAVMDEVNAAAQRERKRIDPRLAKFTAKYKKRQ